MPHPSDTQVKPSRVRPILAGLLLLLCGLLPGRADAQDQSLYRGAGIRMGPGLLFPVFRLRAIVDTNVYRSSADPEPDLVWHLTPAVMYRIDGDDVGFSVWGEYRMRLYSGIGPQDPDSDRKLHGDLDVFTNFSLGADLEIGRQGVVGLGLRNELTVRSREFDPAFRDNDATDNRLQNASEIKAIIRPGSAMTIDAGVRIRLDDWWTRDTGRPEGERRIPLGQALRVAGFGELDWRFGPRTTLIAGIEAGRFQWLRLAEETVQANSDFWQFKVGINGQLTHVLSVQLVVGYANAYFPDFEPTDEADKQVMTAGDGFIGSAVATLTPREGQRISLGFDRGWQYSNFTSYYQNNHVFLRYQGVFFQRLEVTVGGELDHRTLRGARRRRDWEVRARAGVNVQATSFLEVGARYMLRTVVESLPPNPDVATPPADFDPADFEFIDHQVVVEAKAYF